MAFSLKKLLEGAHEAIADFIPGGETGASIRAARKKPAPARIAPARPAPARPVSTIRRLDNQLKNTDIGRASQKLNQYNPFTMAANWAIKNIGSALKYSSPEYKKAVEDQKLLNRRQIMKKYSQGQLSREHAQILMNRQEDTLEDAGLKAIPIRDSKGNLQRTLYANTRKNDTGQSVLEGLGSGIMNAAPQRIIGGVAEFTGNAIGNKGLKKFGRDLSQPFRDYNTITQENAGDKTAYMAGNVAGNLLTLPIGPAGKTGLAYRGVSAGAPTAADTAYAIEQAGGNRTTQLVGGGLAGITSGYLNSVGGEKIFSPVDKVVGRAATGLLGKQATTKLASSGLTRLAQAANNEGLEEALEQGVDEGVAKTTYDKNRSLADSAKNVLTSYLLGAGMGGATRGAIDINARYQGDIGERNLQQDIQRAKNATDVKKVQADLLGNDVAIKQTQANLEVAQATGNQLHESVLTNQLKNLKRERLKLTAQKTLLDKSRNIGLSMQPIDPNEALNAEARKYKSAEEFTLNDGIPRDFDSRRELSSMGIQRVGDTELPLDTSVVIGDTSPIKKGNIRPDPMRTKSGRLVQLQQYKQGAKSTTHVDKKWSEQLFDAAIEEAKFRNDDMNLTIFEDMKARKDYGSVGDANLYLFGVDDPRLTYTGEAQVPKSIYDSLSGIERDTFTSPPKSLAKEPTNALPKPKPVNTRKPTLQDALDGKDTRLKVNPKNTENTPLDQISESANRRPDASVQTQVEHALNEGRHDDASKLTKQIKDPDIRKEVEDIIAYDAPPQNPPKKPEQIYRKQPKKVKETVDRLIEKQDPEAFMQLAKETSKFSPELPKLRPEDVRAITGMSARESGIPPRYLSKDATPIDQLAAQYETDSFSTDGELKMTSEDYLLEYMNELEARARDRGKQSKIVEMRNDPELIKQAQAIVDSERPAKPTEEDWQSMLKQAEQESSPLKSNLLKTRATYNQQIKDAVKSGNKAESARLREEARQINAQIKVMTKQGKEYLSEVPPKQVEEIFQPRDIKDKKVRQTFEQAAKTYLGETNAAAFDRQAKILDLQERYPLTKEEALNALVAIDDASIAPMNGKVKSYIDKFRELTDDAYVDYTQNKGVRMGFQNDYLPRIYKNPATGEAIDGNTYRLLQTGSTRQKGREAELLNEDALIYKDPTQLLDAYYRSMDAAASGQKFLKTLESEGIITASTDPVRGLQPIIAEGMQPGNGLTYYAPREVATKLNRLFGSQEAADLVDKTLMGGAKVNSLWQSVVLSGGVPNSPVNAFGIMQLMKEGMALHPIRGAKAMFGAGFSKKTAKDMFMKRKDIIKLMAENDVAPRIDLERLDKTGRQRIKDRWNTPGKWRKAKGLEQAWDELTNDATFGRMMPMLEVLHFEQVYKKALKKNMFGQGRTPEQAAAIAAESVKNFYGRSSDYKTSVRSRRSQDAASTLLFAPRFRESMVNFWGKSAKALKDPLKLENRDNIKFLAAAGVMYYAMNALNEAWNGVDMWENPDGKKDKLIIPDEKIPFNTNGKDVAIPFLPSLATVPRNAGMGLYNLATGNLEEFLKNAGAFASMPLNAASDVLTNENYFGDQIYDPEASIGDKYKQIGTYVGSQMMQPWIREGLNTTIGSRLSKEDQKAWGFKKKSIAETIANATESPFRFYDPKYYRYDDTWQPSGEVGKKYNIKEQRERTAINKMIKAIPDELGLSNTQKAAYEKLNTFNFDSEGNLKLDNNPFYQAQRATAMQDDGVFEAMKRKAQFEAKLNGKPLDPIYNLSPSQRRLILWKKTLPQGTSDPSISKMYDQEWYQNYRSEQDKYFREKRDYSKRMGYKGSEEDNTNPYPKPNKNLQAKLDYYYTLPKGNGSRSNFLRSNPDVLAYWDNVEAWKNGERAQVGLGNLDSGGSFSGYSRSGGRSGGSRSSSGRSRGGRFDYKLFGFAPSFGKSSKSLQQILKEATR